MRALWLLLMAVCTALAASAAGAPPLPVPLAAMPPLRGINVTGHPLLAPIMAANINYLLTSFTVDHMLLPFRQRAGDPSPPPGPRGQVPFWDSGSYKKKRKKERKKERRKEEGKKEGKIKRAIPETNRKKKNRRALSI